MKVKKGQLLVFDDHFLPHNLTKYAEVPLVVTGYNKQEISFHDGEWDYKENLRNYQLYTDIFIK